MTTPRVTELPRRMEVLSADTFLANAPAPAQTAVVLAFRPRDGRRRSFPARGAGVPRVVALHGDDVA